MALVAGLCFAMATGANPAWAQEAPVDEAAEALGEALDMMRVAEDLSREGDKAAAAEQREAAMRILLAVDRTLSVAGDDHEVLKLRSSAWYHLGRSLCAGGANTDGRTWLQKSLTLYSDSDREKRVSRALDGCPAEETAPAEPMAETEGDRSPIDESAAALSEALDMMRVADDLEAGGENDAAVEKRGAALWLLKATDRTLLDAGDEEAALKLRSAAWYHMGRLLCADGANEAGRSMLTGSLRWYSDADRERRVSRMLESCLEAEVEVAQEPEPVEAGVEPVEDPQQEKVAAPAPRRPPGEGWEPQRPAVTRVEAPESTRAKRGKAGATAYGVLLAVAGGVTVLTTWGVYELSPPTTEVDWSRLQLMNGVGWAGLGGGGLLLVLVVGSSTAAEPGLTMGFTGEF